MVATFKIFRNMNEFIVSRGSRTNQIQRYCTVVYCVSNLRYERILPGRPEDEEFSNHYLRVQRVFSGCPYRSHIFDCTVKCKQTQARTCTRVVADVQAWCK